MSGVLLAVSVLAAASAAALAAPPSSAPAQRRDRSSTHRLGRLPTAAGVLLVVVVLGRHLQGRHLALVLVMSSAAWGALRVVERMREEQLAQRRRLQVVDYCEALVGELRAGQPVTRALDRSVEVWSESEAVAAAARLDASVPAAFRRLATLPGAAAVRRTAAAWEISAGTGSGLVLALEQVLATARAEDATARLVRAELASARATARLVTALPIVVLVAAQGIGARPWHFLLDTPTGIGCLAAAVALNLGGLGWIDRIAAQSVAAGG